MSIQITAAVGNPNNKGVVAPNKPLDVQKINQLLKDLGIAPTLPVSNKCEPATIAAIQEAQKLLGLTADGRIDTPGRTLTGLNNIATPLKLKPVTLTSISNGGYQVRTTTKAPPSPYQLYLALASNPNNRMFVEPDRNGDLITSASLPSLLQLMESANSWGKVGSLKLFVMRNRQVITESSPVAIRCPVKPYKGNLDPASIGADPDIKYTGNGTGRILHMPAINGDYVFVYSGKLVTDIAMRGFDCTTYVGAAYGVDAKTGAMSAYGTKVADHVGAIKCDMEQKKAADIIKFFSENTTGNYLMWNEGHIVMVSNGVVHECTNRAGGGYKTCNIADYPFRTSGQKAYYWIRKVTAEYGSFEPGVTKIQVARPQPVPTP